jgi:hypothetical protein
VRPIGGDAFLQAVAVLLKEAVVLLRVGFRLFIEPLEHALREHLVQLPQERAVLHRLARDIQRQIFAVDDAAEEPQPFGKEPLRLWLDEHLAAVEISPRSRRGRASAARILSGDEKHARIEKRRVGREVQTVERRFRVVADVLVEILVFGVGDLALVFVQSA